MDVLLSRTSYHLIQTYHDAVKMDFIRSYIWADNGGSQDNRQVTTTDMGVHNNFEMRYGDNNSQSSLVRRAVTTTMSPSFFPTTTTPVPNPAYYNVQQQTLRYYHGYREAPVPTTASPPVVRVLSTMLCTELSISEDYGNAGNQNKYDDDDDNVTIISNRDTKSSIDRSGGLYGFDDDTDDDITIISNTDTNSSIHNEGSPFDYDEDDNLTILGNTGVKPNIGIGTSTRLSSAAFINSNHTDERTTSSSSTETIDNTFHAVIKRNTGYEMTDDSMTVASFYNDEAAMSVLTTPTARSALTVPPLAPTMMAASNPTFLSSLSQGSISSRMTASRNHSRFSWLKNRTTKWKPTIRFSWPRKRTPQPKSASVAAVGYINENYNNDDIWFNNETTARSHNNKSNNKERLSFRFSEFLRRGRGRRTNHHHHLRHHYPVVNHKRFDIMAGGEYNHHSGEDHLTVAAYSI